MEPNNEKKQSGAKKHISMQSLLHNNHFVLFISLLMALALWTWVAIEKSPEVEVTISSVPVQINMENSVPAQLKLQIFGNTEYSVDVKVRGKKFVVSSLKPEDFNVIAQTNLVDSAGNKSLQLKASSTASDDFEITGLSKNFIEVYFDTYQEVQLPLEPSILTNHNDTVMDGCILGEVVFSNNTVTLSGPSTEVNKVKRVIAETSVLEPLTSTLTVTPEIKLEGADKDELSNVTIKTGDTKITMTLPVLKEVTLPTTVTLKNAPADYLGGTVPISVYPSSVTAAVPVEKVEQITSLSVGTIDFSELDAGTNAFNFAASEITDYVVSDKNIKNFRVRVSLQGLETTTMSVPYAQISVGNADANYSTSIERADIKNVKIVGPADSLAKIKPEMLSAQVDLSNIKIEDGTQTVPVKITIKGSDNCWASGSYTVKITNKAVA